LSSSTISASTTSSSLGGGVLPPPGSAAASGPIQGSLILFRLKTESLQNRPLELHIGRGEGQEAVIDLDL